MPLFAKLIGSRPGRGLRPYYLIVAKINDLEKEFEALSDEKLKAKTAAFKEQIAAGAGLDDLLPKAFAAVREAAKRTLGQRHYDVQLIGGLVIDEGKIAEMVTGEGKTLVATLPAYLNALAGRGVHIVTVNDYLARRDTVWMGQIYNALGLSVGCINHDASYRYDPAHTEKDKERDEVGAFKIVYEFLRPVTRGEAYQADITYGTNSEFGFDYLRDNLAYSPEQVVQREHFFAVVDEVDSILIDEARTPLIISAPVAESESLYGSFAQIAERLKEGEDYTVDEKVRAIQLTDSGIEKAEKVLGVQNIYTEGGVKYVHHLETAVRAKALFRREREYVIRDGQVIIVDQSTGRLQPGRRWSEGLHQAIEAKEGVKVQEESRTYATVSYQNYFRMYEKLAGMTGTAATSAEEFQKVYGLEVVVIPTNRPLIRASHPDLVFQTEAGKLKAVVRKVKELNQKGQPFLVGTGSIEKNEFLGKLFDREGIKHEILNAKNHEREAEIIAQAGKRGAVTLATNMAGRGVDIKLGGAEAKLEEYEEVKQFGGLFVLGTERHEARRIDNQLRGRSGRQGDPGESQFYTSLEDSLMRVFGSERIKKMMGTFGIPEDQPIESKLVSRSIEQAQAKIEGFNFDARKHLLEYDDVMNFQRQIIYKRRREILFGDENRIEEELKALVTGDEKLEKIVTERGTALGKSAFLQEVRRLILQVIDLLWVEHLEVMEYMRSSVRLRAYGQRDPLVEYKREGLRLFKQLEKSIDETILRLLPNLGGLRVQAEAGAMREVHQAARKIVGESQTSISRRSDVGRNDPCPCGAINPATGKVYKYKYCGLINAPHHKKQA